MHDMTKLYSLTKEVVDEVSGRSPQTALKNAHDYLTKQFGKSTADNFVTWYNNKPKV